MAEALRAHGPAPAASSVPLCDAPDYKVGLGVEGQVNGYYVHLGSERFLRAERHPRRSTAALDRAALDERGYSCLYMAIDGSWPALIPYADQIRAESREVIADAAPDGHSRTPSC